MTEGTLLVGCGTADITPSPGIPLSGFIFRQNRPSEGVDDPLSVRVLALREGDTLVWLISYEVLAIAPQLEQQILAVLEAALGPDFSREHAILTATHTHSAPPTSPLQGEGEPDAAYWALLCDRTVQAARQALETLRPATLHAASYRVPGHTVNRRALLADGRVSMALEPDGFVLERGPVDDTLTLLLLRDSDQRPIAALFHFACHGTVVCTQHISGDIPGAVARHIEERFGATCLYIQGAAGDISPLAVSADRAAMQVWLQPFLADLAPLPDRLLPMDPTPLRLVRAEIGLEYAPLPPRDEVLHKIEHFDRIAAGDVDSPDLQETIRLLGNLMNIKPGQQPDPDKAAYASLALAQAERRVLTALDAGHPPAPRRTTVSVLRLGAIALVCISAEVLAITGFRIRALSRGFGLLPVSYASPIVGYLPDRDALAKGGYEVDDAWRFYRHPAAFAPNSEERVVATVQSLLAQI